MNLDEIAADAGAILKLLEPVLSAVNPPTAAAVAIAGKVAAMVLAEAPAAVAIYRSVTGGTTLTPAQLATIYADEDDADAKLHTAIAAKLATA